MSVGRQTDLKADASVLIRPAVSCTIPVLKSEISAQPQPIIDKWQAILDTLRLVADVPAALIMRVTESEIEVHAASRNKENVYTIGARESLGIGLYCESVMGKDKPLHVPNALADETWKDNPDVPLGMVAYYGTPVKWEDGSFFGTLCILDTKTNEFSTLIRDLVEILRVAIEADLATQRIQSELAVAKEAAEKAYQVKSEFLSLVSHELRTPLNPIIGLGELLKLRSQDPDIQRYAGMICTAANHLLLLINDLLDMGRIERHQLAIRKTSVSLRELIDEAVGMFRYEKEKSGLTIVKPDKRSNYKIHGDPLRIKQIMTNLIDNAIKFTSEGLIRINCHRIGNRIAISVRDTGIGIEPEKQKKIFETFKQADASLSRHYGGMGLGLALASELARLHGGEITVESKPGRGSCFTLWLPDEKSQVSEQDSSSSEEEPSAHGIL